MKSALDVAKMLCLGADRVGFGTMAMVAIGCTICRGCQLDTCHVGIATQLESVAEATDRGVKRFEPREFERAVDNLSRFFTALREDLAHIAAQLGVRATTDLVGRTDLLGQARGLDRVDLRELLEPVTWTPPGRRELRVVAGVAAATEGAEEGRTLRAGDRFVATDASGELARLRIAGAGVADVASSYREGSVAGNGFAAYATDGVVFLRHDPARGLDDAALRDRFAKGAKVHMRAPRDEDLSALRELIDAYADALFASEQTEAAVDVRALLDDPAAHFRAIRPGADITDQTVSTE